MLMVYLTSYTVCGYECTFYKTFKTQLADLLISEHLLFNNNINNNITLADRLTSADRLIIYSALLDNFIQNLKLSGKKSP